MRAREAGASSGDDFEQLYTVSEITAAIRQSLETEFPRVSIAGEIANFKIHTSGHLYMSLRDETSQLRVVLFSRYASRVSFGPENGMTVVATGRISHYGGGGQTQLVATSLQPGGTGAIELRIRRLLQQLMAEGLSDPARRRKTRPYPEVIVVITSPTGAVIRDIRLTLARRWPLAHLVHIPAVVQGPQAEQSILEAFGRVDGMEDVDAVILARGGGSAEDLQAFNAEAVARAVAACRYPVVTGIGHEVDTTVCDYVSDLRAATPTAAAELVAPDGRQVVARLGDMMRRLGTAATTGAARRITSVELLMRSSVFYALERRLDRERIAIDGAFDRLEVWWNGFRDSAEARLDELPGPAAAALAARVGGLNVRLERLSAGLARIAVPEKIAFLHRSLEDTLRAMSTSSAGGLSLVAGCLEGALRALKGLGPRGVLERGYTYCTTVDGKTAVGRVALLVPGDMLAVHFRDGEASCSVEQTRKEEVPWRPRRPSRGR